MTLPADELKSLEVSVGRNVLPVYSVNDNGTEVTVKVVVVVVNNGSDKHVSEMS
jgi:hypothetical protein